MTGRAHECCREEGGEGRGGKQEKCRVIGERDGSRREIGGENAHEPEQVVSVQLPQSVITGTSLT